MGRYDSKFDAQVRGGPEILTNVSSSQGTSYYGRTLVGSSQVVITTQVVRADSIIFLTVHNLGVSSASAILAVTSINPGVGFSIGTVNSIGMLTTSFAAMWEIKNQSE